MQQSDGAVSFKNDILPLFREVDINHMIGMGVLLDDYNFMSQPENAQNVHDFLSGAKKPQMPPGGPYWDQQKLDLLARWIKQGHKP